MNKILSCNNVLAVQNYDIIPEQYLAPNSKQNLTAILKTFDENKFYYDRTGSIPHFLNVDSSAYPIPDSTGFNLSFNEVAEKRAKELLSLGKRINVSWSGGLDSTYILFTLYNLANDKSQIKVYGTYSSVMESGSVFDNHIKDKIEFDIHVNYTHHKNNYNCPDEEIFVTGSNGNDIFYGGNSFGPRDGWLLKAAKEMSIETIDLDADWTKIIPENTMEFLDPFIKKSQRPVRTLQDLRWWISFGFNWYTTRTNSYIGLGKTKSEKIHSFFSADDWQRWSITNTDAVTKTGDYKDERWQLRDMIKYYTGDNTYDSKTNYTSVLSDFGYSWMFLLNDYSNVYLDDMQNPSSVSYK